MRIALAVDGTVRDAAVLAWSVAFAQPGDDLHVVHAYQELALGGSAWLPAVRANDARRDKARQVINSAQAVIHRSLDRARQIVVGGSVLAGWPHQVLTDLSSVADLLVVGSRPGPGPAWALETACPVVVVPPGWRNEPFRGRSVAVVRARDLPVPAMDRAVEFAQRSSMSVLVVHCDDGVVTEAEDDAAALEQLGIQLAPWEHGGGGPAVVAEVRHDFLADGLRALEGGLGLVVLEAGAQPAELVHLVVDELRVPVALVQPEHSAHEQPTAGRSVLQPS
jgi:hypothetical protein